MGIPKRDLLGMTVAVLQTAGLIFGSMKWPYPKKVFQFEFQELNT